MDRRALGFALVFGVAFTLGCGGSQKEQDDAGATSDAGHDASTDAGHDAGRDSSVDAGRDSGVDAGHDAGFDAGHDSGIDAGPIDAGFDAGVDAGPVCECASGPCCDGCHYRAATYVCGANIPMNATCNGTIRYSPSTNATCSGYDSITFDVANRYCTGANSACTGAIVQTGSSMSGACVYTDGDGSPQDPENRLLCQPAPTDVAGNRCRRCF